MDMEYPSEEKDTGRSEFQIPQGITVDKGAIAAVVLQAGLGGDLGCTPRSGGGKIH